MKNGKLFIISAPSSAGKTTLANLVASKLSPQYDITKVITHTTRTPRKYEQEGIDYVFHSPQEFKRLADEGFFLETTEYNGNMYGSPASIITDMQIGKHFIMATDRPGARIIKKIVPEAIFIWINIPDFETLRKRLLSRDTGAEIAEQRLALARKETEEERREQFFQFHIDNDSLEEAQKKIQDILLSYLS